MASIPLDPKQIDRMKQLAENIAGDIQQYIDRHSSVSVERSVLRLYGVDGTTKDDTPIPNMIVDYFENTCGIKNGVSGLFAAACIKSGESPKKTALKIASGKITNEDLKTISKQKIVQKETELSQNALSMLDKSRKSKQKKIKKHSLPPSPWKYLIVATGNIYEDKTQAAAAAMTGADIIAVIRSTAQSLLDYVPFGPTTEGFGGTFATQANFKIMREALDEASEREGRYIRLVNYASGLCMAEIAVCAAFENLDILLNDSMYGILFRDINMKRTFIDQYFSRLICGRAGIMINTGEDNYLTTSDAIENAYTVTTSQLINEAMAKRAGLSDDLLGLGHAFEINPEIKDCMLFEIAHAQLARQLFPNSPIKFMPPTKHKSTDIFYSHALDTLFNLTSVLTDQGIHLTGMLTEAIHTPLMQDRYTSLQNVNYVFQAANSLKDEIVFKKGGIIEKRAIQVLDEAEIFLTDIKNNGLMETISEGKFADIKRAPDKGKGLDGVFEKGENYTNPVLSFIEENPLGGKFA